MMSNSDVGVCAVYSNSLAESYVPHRERNFTVYNISIITRYLRIPRKHTRQFMYVILGVIKIRPLSSFMCLRRKITCMHC